jgi:hypothetical protein
MTEEIQNVINPNQEKPQANKIVKFVIIATVVLGAIWITKKFIFSR